MFGAVGSKKDSVTGRLSYSPQPVDLSGVAAKVPALYKFRAAIARQAEGGAFAKVLFVGDSTTSGALSNATLANYRPNSFPAKLAALLTAKGMPACMTNALGNAVGLQGLNQNPGYWDSRLSGSGQFATIAAPNLGIGGLLLGMATSGAGTISFSPGVSTDTSDIYWFKQGAVFTVNVDGGGAIATLTGDGSQTAAKTTVSYAEGVRTINLVQVSGTGNFGGFDAYTAATPQIHLLNAGSGGATAANLAAAGTYNPGAWYSLIAPDLSVISIGINDWISGTTPAAFSASLQTIITNCQASGDVILMTPFPSATSQASLAAQGALVQVMLSLAATNNILVIDENYNLVSKTAMTTNGLGADVNHPNGIGTAVIARDIAAAILQVIQ